MREIVAVDIGGTHARFAIASIENGTVAELGEAVTLKCAEHASLALAWEAFGRTLDRPLPREAGIAVACPVTGEILKMTNNPWVIHPTQLASRLHLDNFVLVNDFGAVAHAVAQVNSSYMRHLCGPDVDLPSQGTITIVGPGTGLGAACLLRRGENTLSWRPRAATSTTHHSTKLKTTSSRRSASVSGAFQQNASCLAPA